MASATTAKISVHDVVDLLCAMLRFDTTNPPGNEKPLAEMLAAFMSEKGFAVELTDLGNNRANVTARLNGNGERKTLLFNGHLDVVPPGQMAWEHASPFDPVVKDGKIYGRGSSDMKGGLAAMIVAATAVKATGRALKGDLIITCSADEESGSLGARDFRQKGGLENVGAIIVGESSSCGINIAEKGALWIEIYTVGKTAHGAFPEQGINAITAMNAVLTELTNYTFSYQPNKLLGHPSLNISTIQGGVKTNVVPDRCVLTLDIRTVPGMEHNGIVKDIQAICERVKTERPGLSIEVNPINDRPAVETVANDPFIVMAQEVIRDNFGREESVHGVSFYTDAAIFLPGTNIPAILYGPGEAAMAHQPNEYVPIAGLEEAARFYAAMIERYLID
ncbi:MAG: M20 family metallopeptidase [Betaproteobacteria bacterium]|nr:M20 family metallopeptidase [Betaproteobacteria bacterium]